MLSIAMPCWSLGSCPCYGLDLLVRILVVFCAVGALYGLDGAFAFQPWCLAWFVLWLFLASRSQFRFAFSVS